jgi:hypothetical protein
VLPQQNAALRGRRWLGRIALVGALLVSACAEERTAQSDARATDDAGESAMGDASRAADASADPGADASALLPDASADASAGCMPGVFGLSVFGGACFQ